MTCGPCGTRGHSNSSMLSTRPAGSSHARHFGGAGGGGAGLPGGGPELAGLVGCFVEPSVYSVIVGLLAVTHIPVSAPSVRLRVRRRDPSRPVRGQGSPGRGSATIGVNH